MRSTRVFQLTALALVSVACVQVGWWLLDQHNSVIEKVSTERALYAQQITAARELLDSGVAVERVRAVFPGLAIQAAAGKNRVSVAPAVEEALASERARRINQYVWEGAFFLLALAACIGAIWRALRAESRVMQEQDSFLALVSHQFKTPLASLQLSLETMAIRPLSHEQTRTLIERMLADLARMVAMVSQILDSVRFERGRVDLKCEPIELASAVARVTGQFEERARKDSVVVAADVPRGLAVLADPLATDAVIRNVLENALAAVAQAGGGTISLTARRAGTGIELVICDSGVGFRPEDAALLFKKFSRLQPASGNGYYGTGLGLYIVQRLMQLAGGRVDARSDGSGRGATFVLTWPAANVALQSGERP